MSIQTQAPKGYGLFRNYGWKKNLRSAVLGFLIFAVSTLASGFLESSRILSAFDISVAVMPLTGLFLGIWGVAGSMTAYFLAMTVSLGLYLHFSALFTATYFIHSVFINLVYSCLPCILWYAVKLRDEDRVSFPRMDTSAHFIKYYLIMVCSVAIYVLLSVLSQLWRTGSAAPFMKWFLVFIQYLDVVLVLGLPVMIIASKWKYRSISINERMVLSFVLFGIAATSLCGYMVYRITVLVDPSVFSDYEALVLNAYDSINEAGMAAYERYEQYWDWFYVIIAVVFTLLVLLEIVMMRAIEKKVTDPIIHLSGVLGDYAESPDEALNSGMVKEECGPYENGYGEVSSLTNACVDMVDRIDTYTENLKQATSAAEKIGTELEIASRIQMDMLPGVFPAFPEREEIDLYASMTPALEVGGDFYDFYLTDRNHLALVIGDVSGKGVPAAMFMAISKTLMKNHAQAGRSPKEILTFVNHQLCQNNTSIMFCTLWLGILDLRDGTMVCANAGHEYPLITKENGRFEYLKDKHDLPLGIRDGIRYREYEIHLNPGDCLFEYTDGVTEATSEKEELFGEERTLEAINRDPSLSTERIIGNMYEAIDAFVNEAMQFDDITMLCVRYNGARAVPEHIRHAYLRVPAKVSELGSVTDFAEEQLMAAGGSPADVFNFSLCVEEIFVNIASYAYDGRDGDAEIEFSCDEISRIAEFVLLDRGIPFDPTTRKAPDITLPAAERPVGGLGIHIVRKLMDETVYEYAGGKNILSMRKKLNVSEEDREI